MSQGDARPADCRFRLREEGKAYPRSGCRACGATIASGLGSSCNRVPRNEPTDTSALVERKVETMLALLRGWSDSEFAEAASGEFGEDLKARIEGIIANQADALAAKDAENARLNAECERRVEANSITFEQAMSNGEALADARTEIAALRRVVAEAVGAFQAIVEDTKYVENAYARDANRLARTFLTTHAGSE